MAIRLILYSKPGCHLCEIMAGMVRHVGRTVPLTLDEIDITSDRVLLTRYQTAIPVLMIGDREIARYRVGELELRRLLAMEEGNSAG
jgi:hypothetical protein